MKVESLFADALEKSTTAERQAFLDEACGSDDVLRQRVERLLAVHDHDAGVLERGPDTALFVQSHLESALERDHLFAGRFKLREKLGVGGMGEVWVADQIEPMQRRVALKVVKPGLDSARMLARFDQERQALALMDHPNIAKVFDAGTTESNPKTETRNPKQTRSTKPQIQHEAGQEVSDIGASGLGSVSDFDIRVSDLSAGRPYFVMELIKGVPITRYCDEARLSPRQRLELFIPVCHAVQHAHQKGIIHRDLKPSNILVALYDGVAVPKVIDFGVAKATGPRLTGQSIYTEVGAFIGTLEYMAPEQAKLNNLDIDTRADIYALGAVLYELLTGSLPFSRQELEAAEFIEMLRMIKEVEPPKPSTRLSSSETLPSVAEVRQMEPKQLISLVRGELDWIVVKCLEKDRARRYESASELALDLQRYLADEPVSAGPPSVSYRLRKFVRRNRWPVLAASVILLLLLGGIVGTTAGLLEARSQRDAAVAARFDEAREKKLASERLVQVQAEQQRADEERAVAQAVNEFLRKDLLHQANIANQPFGPDQPERNRNISVRDLLDRAAKTVRGKFANQPLVEAAVHQTLADTYVALGEYEPALAHGRRAVDLRTAKLGPDDHETLNSLNSLAIAYRAAGQVNDAISLYRQIHEGTLKKLGPDHVDTLITLQNLAVAYMDAGKRAEAIRLYEQVRDVQIKKLGPEHPNTLATLNNLGRAYQLTGRYAEAIELLRQVRDVRVRQLGPDHPDTLLSRVGLGGAHLQAGHANEAINLLADARDASMKALGPEHPTTLIALGNLATAYITAGDKAEAVTLLEQVRDAQLKKHGPNHPLTLVTLNNLAAAYQAVSRTGEAVSLYAQVYDALLKRNGPHHPETLRTLHNLASAYQADGKMTEAITRLEQARDLLTEHLGLEHPNTLATLGQLGSAYLSVGKPLQAIDPLEKVRAVHVKTLDADHPRLLTTQNNLALAYQGAGQLEQALPLFQHVVAAVEKRQFAKEDAGRLVANLIHCHECLNQYEQAEAWRRKWLAVVKNKSEAEPVPYAQELTGLGANLLKQKKPADAEALLRQSLAILQDRQPKDWTTFMTHSLLGAALLAQQRYADAEPLLLTGYAGLKQCEDKPTTSTKAALVETLERLVQLYLATDRKDEAAKWRKELEARGK